MPWTVQVSEDAIDDAEWFGRKLGRALLQAAIERLGNDPLVETRHLKLCVPTRSRNVNCESWATIVFCSTWITTIKS